MPAPRADRVLATTRILAWVIAPVLLLAFAVLWPVPTDTARLFAWHIVPTMTPMVLASAYLGGAYFFVRTGLNRTWHSVRGGFPPVAVFPLLLGVATILHWDKFNHSSPAFWLWAGLYFSTPFLVCGAFLANRSQDPGIVAGDLEIATAAARLVAAIGGLAFATGLFLFASPATAISVWPWTLTPLTARVMGAVFCLGLAGIGTTLDRRWSSARIPVQVGIIMLVLMVISGARARAELFTARPLTWAFVFGFPLLLVVMSSWYLRMEGRRRG